MSFIIEKINDGKGSEVSFCPSRGGIITSLKLQGKEILYFDQETFLDKNLSVRGGIPILFPNAGEIPKNDILPNLSRHGFARNLEWESTKDKDFFSETLLFNDYTLKVYPYKFKLIINGKLEDDSFILTQEVENLGDIDMPVSFGLHPYFYVSNNEKGNVIFNFPSGIEIKDNFDAWSSGGTVSIDNPKENGHNVEIVLPEIGRISIDASSIYKKIWVWSLPGKDFICIEPIMRDEGGIINNPEIVKSGQKIQSYLRIRLVQ